MNPAIGKEHAMIKPALALLALFSTLSAHAATGRAQLEFQTFQGADPAIGFDVALMGNTLWGKLVGYGGASIELKKASDGSWSGHIGSSPVFTQAPIQGSVGATVVPLGEQLNQLDLYQLYYMNGIVFVGGGAYITTDGGAHLALGSDALALTRQSNANVYEGNSALGNGQLKASLRTSGDLAPMNLLRLEPELFVILYVYALVDLNMDPAGGMRH
jgi:hypothetical protein